MSLVALSVVVVGGAASVVRYLVTLAIVGREPLPWAVFAVNVVGSALGGAVLGWSEAAALSEAARLILLAGVAGGLTTFSAFSVETMQLVMTGKWRSAIGNVLANVVVGLTVAALAFALSRSGGGGGFLGM